MILITSETDCRVLNCPIFTSDVLSVMITIHQVLNHLAKRKKLIGILSENYNWTSIIIIFFVFTSLALFSVKALKFLEGNGYCNYH